MAGRPLRRQRLQEEGGRKAAEHRKTRQVHRAHQLSLPEERRLSVRKDMRHLARWYFKGTDGKPYRLADYHVEILEAMFEGGYVIVNVPTDHMKSSLGCFLFPLFSLMENPNETHIICGANMGDSKRRVQALERELESNKQLQEDYPWVAKPAEAKDRVWSATQFNVVGRTINKPNPSVLASAIGSNDLKGRRGKLIMDDVEGEDARWSPTKREQLYSWLKFEAWRCYEDRRETPRPLLCLLGTPFDVDSIHFRMEQQGWKTIRYPCYLDGGLEPKEPVLDSMGNRWATPPRRYLWPEKKEKVDLARIKLRTLEFSVAYLMDPTGGDRSRLSAAEIRKRIQDVDGPIEDHSTGFVTLDPASAMRSVHGDYAGLAVVRVQWPQGDELPRVDVLEAHQFTRGLFEQVHFCAELSKRYGYPVIYEGNSQQGGVYQNTFMHLHPDIPIVRHFTSHSNKFDDAMGMTVVKRLVEKRLLYVPPDDLDSEGVLALVQEVRDLVPPFKQHNHISAAIWFAVRYVYERIRHYRTPPISLSYALNPVTQAQGIWNYVDDPSLPPLERAYRAIGYDRTARSGMPAVVGYTAFRQQQQMPWEKNLADEQVKFEEALRKRRAG